MILTNTSDISWADVTAKITDKFELNMETYQDDGWSGLELPAEKVPVILARFQCGSGTFLLYILRNEYT